MAGETQTDPAKAAGEATAAALKPSFDAILESLSGIAKPAPAAAPAATPAAKKVWTRGELDAEVAAGRLTQDTADRVLDEQQAARVATAVKQELRSEQTESAVVNEIRRYAALIPDLMAGKGPQFERSAVFFNRAVARGSPANDSTRLMALEAAFGTIEALEQAAGNTGRRETHQEHGGGGSSDLGGNDSDGAPKGLNNRQKAHYADKISKGVYRDWGAVRAEIDNAGKRRPRA